MFHWLNIWYLIISASSTWNVVDRLWVRARLLLNSVYLVEKQQIPILYSFWFFTRPGSNSQSIYHIPWGACTTDTVYCGLLCQSVATCLPVDCCVRV
jgi:hypothetical protein